MVVVVVVGEGVGGRGLMEDRMSVCVYSASFLIQVGLGGFGNPGVEITSFTDVSNISDTDGAIQIAGKEGGETKRKGVWGRLVDSIEMDALIKDTAPRAVV